MSNLENWLEENQWQLCTTEVKDLREAVAADITEALKISHNTGSPKLPTLEECKVEAAKQYTGSDLPQGALLAVETVYNHIIGRQLRVGA